MNTARMAAATVTMVFILFGCSQPGMDSRTYAPAEFEEPVSFINRVWVVAESTSMAPGQMVVFLSEGTLVFASPHGTPAFGTWRRDGAGLIMVEEGIAYKVDMQGLSETEFRIHSHNPGEPVETRFVNSCGVPTCPGLGC